MLSIHPNAKVKFKAMFHHLSIVSGNFLVISQSPAGHSGPLSDQATYAKAAPLRWPTKTIYAERMVWGLTGCLKMG
jgi:hypothetical protein